MAQIFDTSQMYLSWPNTITVTYLSKSAEAPPGTGPQITNVLWTAIKKLALPPDSPLAKMDRRFRMANAVMHGIVPKKDDILIDDQGNRWRVMEAEILSFGNEYRVYTVKSTKQNQPVAQ